jgi:hypothetical protein
MESNCQPWLIAIRTHKYSGRCILGGCDDCPGHKLHTELGKKEKSFQITNTKYRDMSSAAHYLVKESNSKVLFITLTFPKFKKKVTDNEINTYFSKFVENLRQNYDCGGYVSVRERGEKHNRVHFHLLLAIPFVPFNVLNDSWCHCIKDICYYSKNALQTDRKTVFIRNPVRALRYVCKYFAKAKNQASKSRLVFMSNNILQKPFKYVGNVRDFLTGYESITFTQSSDFSTLFRITDAREFNRFCETFLYALFELSDKKTDLYSFPPG